MRLILHIGTEKTGTTAIQEALYRHRSDLAQEGVVLLDSPGTGNNRLFPAFFAERNFADDLYHAEGLTTLTKAEAYFTNFERRARAELQDLPIGTKSVIITSEHFHSRLTSSVGIARAKAFFSAYFDEIEIIVFFRDQAAVVKSLYSTALKVGHKTDQRRFFADKAKDRLYLDYNALIRRWSDVFGRETIDIHLYSEARSARGGLLGCFARAAGIATDVSAGIGRGANESLGPMGERLFRTINSAFPTYIDGRFTGWRSRIGQMLRKLTKLVLGSRLYRGQLTFDRDAEEALRETYRESNIQFFNNYLGGTSGRFD